MRILILLTLVLFISACDKTPAPINFGKDQCSSCKMNIVDSQHAAQYVTKKGKQFKFDAIECMLDEIIELGTEDLGTILVSDYSVPGNMTDAKSATYLICAEIKSPMGAFLSAFASKEQAIETQKANGGDIYDWNSVLEKRKGN